MLKPGQNQRAIATTRTQNPYQSLRVYLLCATKRIIGRTVLCNQGKWCRQRPSLCISLPSMDAVGVASPTPFKPGPRVHLRISIMFHLDPWLAPWLGCVLAPPFDWVQGGPSRLIRMVTKVTWVRSRFLLARL